MKRKISVLLVVTLLVAMLASAALADAQLTIAWWGNQTRNERTQAALDLYSEQNAGVTFDPQMNAWSDY